jgi:hypothetical protein
MTRTFSSVALGKRRLTGEAMVRSAFNHLIKMSPVSLL